MTAEENKDSINDKVFRNLGNQNNDTISDPKTVSIKAINDIL